MSAPSGIRSGVGFRGAFLFALNAAGLPAATATTAYTGIQVTGAKVLTINDPEPRRINHMGDDTIISIDVLPPAEALTGELRVGKLNDVVDALLTGQKQFTVGTSALFGVGTDKRGYETQVGMLAYRQAQDTDPASSTFGMRTWDFRIMPKVQLIARDAGYSDQPEEFTYTVIPAKVTAHIWGTAFSEGTEGFTQAQMVRGVSFGKPRVVAWKGDGTAVAFTFPTTAQASSTDTISIWKNGTLVSSGLTKAVSGVTFTTAPTSGDIVVALYETP